MGVDYIIWIACRFNSCIYFKQSCLHSQFVLSKGLLGFSDASVCGGTAEGPAEL